jgi:hypothetical protein
MVTVMVETVELHKKTYVIRTKEASWALDDITMKECSPVSTVVLDEVIVSHRVIGADNHDN